MKKLFKYILLSMIMCFSLLLGKSFSQSESSSISSLEEITLGGVKQWILIRGDKASNPILLFLHGGPGFPEIPYVHIDSQRLEEHFTVVNWDQRGAGKSYNAGTNKVTMELKSFLSDTHELIQLLKRRFSKNKIYLIGHSWGSILGLHTAYKYPEDLHAYIGMGQVVDVEKGEQISYKYTVKKAIEAKDEEATKMLENIGCPPYKEGFKSLSTQRMLLAKYGGSFRNISYQDLGMYWNTSPYYSETDVQNIMNAFAITQNAMWDKLGKVNLIKEIPEVTVPVFFFTGRYDYQAPFELVECYFKSLIAPHKEIIWFENSGHMPNLDEPELYQDKLIEIVLNKTFVLEK